MANNVDRTLNLLGYLPEILRNSLEMQTIMSAETPVVQALWEACEYCLDDQFIADATENGIARRETMLGLVANATDTIDERRLRVYAKYNEKIPYTRTTLETLLDSLCGKNAYVLEILTGDFTVKVEVGLTVQSQAEIVAESLERILPYNMVFSVEIMYNTWAHVANMTWGEIEGKTWKQLREDVLV